jgi:hypothetical protein
MELREMANISYTTRTSYRHPDTFRWQIRGVWLLLGLIFFLVALGGAVEHGSSDPIPNFAPGDCTAPCWEGLRPGETQSTQALALLYQQYGTQQVHHEDEHVSWQVAPGITGRASLEGGQLGTIVFHFAPDHFRLSQLVQQVGQPQQVHVTLPHAPRGVQPERSCEVLRLLYSDLQMEVTLHESRSGEALPQHSLARLYVAPDRPERTILTPFYTRDWEGYGGQCVSLDEVFES